MHHYHKAPSMSTLLTSILPSPLHSRVSISPSPSHPRHASPSSNSAPQLERAAERACALETEDAAALPQGQTRTKAARVASWEDGDDEEEDGDSLCRPLDEQVNGRAPVSDALTTTLTTATPPPSPPQRLAYLPAAR